MPLWLDLLRTPMAAPESRSLRRMRFTWQGLCLSLAFTVTLFTPFHRIAGQLAPVLVAILLLATALYTWLYLVRKHRIDKDFLERVGESE
ncbi:hypothetical protein O4H52_20420 [Sphingomonadaceae bacterium G21617-S1]|jgi:drug/metabolite transporter (DMT)-like permease|uniref:hypothetical protein n=1 Tax=Sphingobium sp. CECT 9361 TaxID=2845384 RepID=UPI001E563E41|nr:hypothetical protein [Sphingobium sp. CECT 9361]MCZ4343979.1 hypothetical protein [Sphingomonadaceae bacterium G21617-S1]CAH0356397.1 hypothetical protein SPH9361_04057 [Sphingobium sp. CECT 9361]